MKFERNQAILLKTGPALLVEFLTQDTVIVETWTEENGYRSTVLALEEIVSQHDFPDPLRELQELRAAKEPRATGPPALEGTMLPN